ncbi:TPA: hypothetical protein N0F65_002851 [Lagenidium giganteum]|uniref:Type 1 phosphatases regulator n=1 Tax=Lagenidium giganteum TaxID=4803 RepID=A0AAV2Z923_9STRA|nr:TPA: hypothetical protein N0F65_002851 [Lagenidium giganteum]
MNVREQVAAPATASATEVVEPTEQAEASVYHVRLQPRAHVTFAESVVDNEHLGRKKSNKCCIFHKKREFGESSSESGEDSDPEHHAHNHKNCGHRRKRIPAKKTENGSADAAPAAPTQT